MKTYLIAYIASDNSICTTKINAESQYSARLIFQATDWTSEVLAITELEQDAEVKQ